jgi:hypothetical protein
MTGDSPESLTEGREVSGRILQSDALHRLAENPLLLTMLLVVKHGAGRLPPDRVTLYDRAVEVLLDTWNIKGHDALNSKEAVPQLAFVAFQLMRLGRQTATEAELLTILEEAREKVPQIRRYAKDSPHEFLKRVELRSSLLVEAGHQLEGTKTVPFYQFRHLTFQEHLAAVAAVEGHYVEYEKNDTVLTPLADYLSAEDWKEVIPMAAVLARKQAEPLLAALVVQGNALRQMVFRGSEFPELSYWRTGKMPAPVARLVQCLAEEAEASPETLTNALQIIALFARGCRSQDNWQELSRGPYGAELLHQALLLYSPMNWPIESWARNTLAVLLVFRRPLSFWQSDEARQEITRLLKSEQADDNIRGLLTIAGLYWNSLEWGMPGSRRVKREALTIGRIPLKEIERHIFQDAPSIWHAATWAWALARKDLARESVEADLPSSLLLNQLLTRWAAGDGEMGIISFALSTLAGMERDIWKPVLADEQRQFLKTMADSKPPATGLIDSRVVAALIIGFHSRDVWPEEELARRLFALEGSRSALRLRDGIHSMLRQFDAGLAILRTR